MYRRLLIIVVCLLNGIAAVQITDAAEVMLIPAADTTLLEINPSNNFGGATYFNSGSIQNTVAGLPPPYLYPRNRGLFSFDIAGNIPAGSKILSVSMSIEVTRISNDNPGSNARYHLHRMLRHWGEGNKVTYIDPPRLSTNGLGALATLGEASWNHRMAETTNTWAIPGGAAGIDYAAQPTATQDIFGPASSPYYFQSQLNSNLVQEIQFWLDHPERNFGWMIKADNELVDWTARRFGSRESTLPPRMTIQFIPPPVLEDLRISGQQLRFTFTAIQGLTYALEYRDSLTSGTWQTLTTLTLPGATAQVVLTDTIQTLGARFYRLSVY